MLGFPLVGLIVYLLTGEKGIARTRIVFVGKGREGQELYIVDLPGAKFLAHDNAKNQIRRRLNSHYSDRPPRGKSNERGCNSSILISILEVQEMS